jgi:spore maturation protein SpmB
MDRDFNPFKQGAISGLHKGWESFLWMMEIIIPVSFATMLLGWSGWLNYLDVVLKPAMGIINLPAAAALPLIIGMLTGLYGGIAAMMALPFTQEQMTLIGIFILTAHNLIQEGIIQGKSGVNPLKATFVRIGAAILTLWLLTPWFAPSIPAANVVGAAATTIRPLFLPVVQSWIASTAWLALKAFLVIMSVLTIMEILKTSGWVRYVIAFFSPLLKFMGLDKKLTLLWITAILFGLAYGGSVIMEESKGGHLSKEDLETLHLSIGINHSLIEDTLLLVALGLSAFWLYIPRLMMAVVAVHLLKILHYFKKRRGESFVETRKKGDLNQYETGK